MSSRRQTRFPCALLVLAACVPADTSDRQLRILTFVLDEWKLAVSALGFAGTAIALLFGLRQYRRAEQWKRAEFIAREMKEFFENAKVRTALMLSDWGSRHVSLLGFVIPGDTSVTHVTRETQCAALLPHTLVTPTVGSDFEGPLREGEAMRMRRFTREQAVIRDCYDAYLDGLERFGSFLSAELVSVRDLKPYLAYWVDDLAQATHDCEDAAWSACLLTYINFYGYAGVVELFRAFGHDIRPGGPVLGSFTRAMKDQELASRLLDSIAPARAA